MTEMFSGMGLIRFCKKQRVTRLKVETFASPVTHIPSENGEENRRERSEFLIELQKPNLRANYRKTMRVTLNVVVRLEYMFNGQATPKHARRMLN